MEGSPGSWVELHRGWHRRMRLATYVPDYTSVGALTSGQIHCPKSAKLQSMISTQLVCIYKEWSDRTCMHNYISCNNI